MKEKETKDKCQNNRQVNQPKKETLTLGGSIKYDSLIHIKE